MPSWDVNSPNEVEVKMRKIRGRCYDVRSFRTLDTPFLKACDCSHGHLVIRVHLLLKEHQYPGGQRSVVKKPKADFLVQSSHITMTQDVVRYKKLMVGNIALSCRRHGYYLQLALDTCLPLTSECNFFAPRWTLFI